MELYVKPFDRLTSRELYELLAARAAVFVVEQHCAYQDPDGVDLQATHVFLRENGRLLACLRIHREDAATARIGRVLTLRRGEGLGARLLEAGIRAVRDMGGFTAVAVEAQSYATGFYEKFGFRVVSEEFPEDGIPHKRMVLKL